MKRIVTRNTQLSLFREKSVKNKPSRSKSLLTNKLKLKNCWELEFYGGKGIVKWNKQVGGKSSLLLSFTVNSQLYEYNYSSLSAWMLSRKEQLLLVLSIHPSIHPHIANWKKSIANEKNTISCSKKFISLLSAFFAQVLFTKETEEMWCKVLCSAIRQTSHR